MNILLPMGGMVTHWLMSQQNNLPNTTSLIDSFVPMLQAVYSSPIELHQTPDWSDKPYNVHRDPLWKTTKQSKGFDDVWFYHCDHLGTPQEMSDHTGAIIWKAVYKAWGEC